MDANEIADLRTIIRDEATKTLLQHLSLCPYATLQVEPRLRALEISYARLLGFMAGAGILGGTLGATLTKTVMP